MRSLQRGSFEEVTLKRSEVLPWLDLTTMGNINYGQKKRRSERLLQRGQFKEAAAKRPLQRG